MFNVASINKIFFYTYTYIWLVLSIKLTHAMWTKCSTKFFAKLSMNFELILLNYAMFLWRDICSNCFYNLKIIFLFPLFV